VFRRGKLIILGLTRKRRTPTQSVHPQYEAGRAVHLKYAERKIYKTVFYSYSARFLNTVTLNAYMCPSNTGCTGWNT